MSYQTSSKRSPPFLLLIGARSFLRAIYFPAHLDFSSSPLSAPGSPRMTLSLPIYNCCRNLSNWCKAKRDIIGIRKGNEETTVCRYGQAPNYLIDFIIIKKQSRYSLRSNESIFLELPGIKTHPTLGDRAFLSAAPYL